MKDVKDTIINNQIQNLSQLYIMLASSLSPTIAQRQDGPADVVHCNLSVAVKGAAEVALIDVCNRISALATDASRWTLDEADVTVYGNKLDAAAEKAKQDLLMAFLAELGTKSTPAKPKKPKKKGPSDEQK
jgi:hypothetical protein